MLTTIIIMIVMLIIIMMLMILFMRAMSTSRSGKESTVEFFLDELAELELARVAPELKIIDIAGENGATVMMVVKNGDTIRDPDGHFFYLKASIRWETPPRGLRLARNFSSSSRHEYLDYFTFDFSQ